MHEIKIFHTVIKSKAMQWARWDGEKANGGAGVEKEGTK